MTIEIRKYLKGDGEQVELLLKQLTPNSNFSEEDFLKASSISTGFVAEIEGQIVGFAALCYRYVPDHGRHTASVESVVVHGDFRRRGIGEALLDRLIDEAQFSKLASIDLHTSESRTGAIKLYEKYGFKYAASRCYFLKL